MVYTFEGVEYRQCHFIGTAVNSVDEMEKLFALLCVEHKISKIIPMPA